MLIVNAISRRDILKLTGALLAVPILRTPASLTRLILDPRTNSAPFDHIEIFISRLDLLTDGGIKTMAIFDMINKATSIAAGPVTMTSPDKDGDADVVMEGPGTVLATGENYGPDHLNAAYAFSDKEIQSKNPNEGGTKTIRIIPSVTISPELLATEIPGTPEYTRQIEEKKQLFEQLKQPNAKYPEGAKFDELRGTFTGTAVLHIANEKNSRTAKLLYYLTAKDKSHHYVGGVNLVEARMSTAKPEMKAGGRTTHVRLNVAEPTPEPVVVKPEFPDVGDERYADYLEENEIAWQIITEDGKEYIVCDFDKNGLDASGKIIDGYKAFERVGNEWVVEEWREPVPPEGTLVTTEGIGGGTARNGGCFYPNGETLYRLEGKFNGGYRIKRRYDFETGKKLPGYMIIAQVVTRNSKDGPDFVVELITHADDGDKINMIAPAGLGKEIGDIFDYKNIFKPGKALGVNFAIAQDSRLNDWKPYEWTKPAIKNNAAFAKNPEDYNRYLIVPAGSFSSR